VPRQQRVGSGDSYWRDGLLVLMTIGTLPQRRVPGSSDSSARPGRSPSALDAASVAGTVPDGVPASIAARTNMYTIRSRPV
jgi:hypothetical protein